MLGTPLGVTGEDPGCSRQTTFSDEVANGAFG